MEDGASELDMTEVAGALGHALTAGLALEVAVDGAHLGVHEAANLGFLGDLIHDLRVLDLGDRIGFLRAGSASAMGMRGKERLTISSGERIPNWTSFTFRRGAAEYAN
jgi:hypothetical protein